MSRTKEGETYVGEFFNDEQHGEGVFTSPEGDKYEGSWKFGTQNGFGEYLFPNGDKYRGEWKEGDPHGEGKMQSQHYVYEGEWKMGKKEGKGKLTLKSDGRVFEGIWKDDRFIQPKSELVG